MAVSREPGDLLAAVVHSSAGGAPSEREFPSDDRYGSRSTARRSHVSSLRIGTHLNMSVGTTDPFTHHGAPLIVLRSFGKFYGLDSRTATSLTPASINCSAR